MCPKAEIEADLSQCADLAAIRLAVAGRCLVGRTPETESDRKKRISALWSIVESFVQRFDVAAASPPCRRIASSIVLALPSCR